MNIKRPIAFVDVETTGTNVVTDRIVAIAITKLMVDGSTEKRYKLIDPEIPIPIEATNVNGITDEDVKGKEKFREIAKSLHALLQDCDFGGFNIIKFDIPILSEHFSRCGLNFPPTDAKFVDSYHIYKLKESRNLENAYKFYCGKKMENAHNAINDVNVSYEVLEGQMKMYDMNIEDVIDFCNNPNKVDVSGKLIRDKDGDICYAFGKHAGKKVKDEKDYAKWMISGNFSENTKEFLVKCLEESKLTK